MSDNQRYSEEDLTEQIKLEVADGKLSFSVDAWNIWAMLPQEEKEIIMHDEPHWDIISAALVHEIGKGVSGESFNNSLHKLRILIATDKEMVSNMIVTLVEELLKIIGQAKQSERAADAAYWKLYHKTQDIREKETPLDIKREEPYFRFKTSEIHEDVEDMFAKLLSSI